ncbi:hypothetical protein [Enterococcus sp. AZ101]|uniref:hypothetical protein n=1 Tax=Enterococcus sp. AZ101 TaxID=2774742 RepID=UPI003D26FCC4
MYKKLSNFYMAVAIIGIITAVPIIGSFFDLFRILTMVLLGFSIYLLVKQPKEIKRTANVLMIISCVLVLKCVISKFSNFTAVLGDKVRDTISCLDRTVLIHKETLCIG